MQDIKQYFPLVHYVVRRWRRKHPREEYADLFQVGCVGLIKAIHKFDPARGFQFSSYAVPSISGEIRNYIRDTQLIHMPRTIQNLSLQVLSLDYTYASDDNKETTMLDLYPQFDDYSGVELNEYLSELTAREKEILRCRLVGMNQTEIGKRLGCKQSHVSRMIQKIKTKLVRYREAV